MKLKSLATGLGLILTLTSPAQSDQQLFAITGQEKDHFSWSDIRALDMKNGSSSELMFKNNESQFTFRYFDTKSIVDRWQVPGIPAVIKNGNTVTSKKIIIVNPTPTTLKSAAIAYDKKHEKLFFASMKSGNLLWMDLSESKKIPSFYTIREPLIEVSDAGDEAINITRMTIGADGLGYALTNDGNNLITFTTGNKIVVKQLGALIDDESNGSISIHNQCTSWGGDMVGHASGKLYILSAAQNVFELNPSTKITTFIGRVKGLPASFSLNGAAVDKDDRVVVSSANTFDGFFRIDLQTLSAEKMETEGKVYNASDLASSHLLGESLQRAGAPVLPAPQVSGNQNISVYPNPVKGGRIRIIFEQIPPGEYQVSLTDLQGRSIETQNTIVRYKGQQETYKLKQKPAKGFYFMKITAKNGDAIFTDKLIIE